MAREIKFVNLHEILPDAKIDYDHYYDSEVQLSKQLAEAGYENTGLWRDGERDSWGPLSRYIITTGQDGVNYKVVYG
ncbi:MAG: hypothetical protein LC687_02220 [Actinobacteria bacterium]|nr:hypothetical protein [Actinomycetota bacterium]